MKYEGKRIDCHVHYKLPGKNFSDEKPSTCEQMKNTLSKCGVSIANLVLVPERSRLSSVPDALAAKAQNPGFYYVFSSLDVTVLFKNQGRIGKPMREYAKKMLKAGCDGIKIIEGKPAMRKMMPVPSFDDPQWDPFWAWAEAEGVPILWHVNDPEEFWDLKKAPKWAVERGWCYDETFINNEAQYTEVLNMLAKFPKIKIIFAHFFFMSAQLDRLASILDRYPNISVDLTPGIEMYRNFSENAEAARAFFLKYQDRIVYGTDVGAQNVLSENPFSEEESTARTMIVQNFLEKDKPYELKPDGHFLSAERVFRVVPMDFDQTVLKKIYHENFERFVGGEPRPVNKRLAVKECDRILINLKIMTFLDKELIPDDSCAKQVKSYFKKRRER